MEKQALELQQFFRQSDQDFIRVLEDVVYLLVDKKTIKLTDLPQSAQDKIKARKDKRK